MLVYEDSLCNHRSATQHTVSPGDISMKEIVLKTIFACTCRRNPNISGISSTTGDFSAENTPNATPAPSVLGDAEPASGHQNAANTDLDQLETLSIGSYRRQRSPPGKCSN